MAVKFLDEVLVKLNGTSSSKQYLEINGGGASGSLSGQAGVGFRPLNAGSNVHASIEAFENGNASYKTYMTLNTNGSNSDSAPSERMRITSAGNVGIGTTSPNRLLTVQTTSSGSYLALNSSSNNTTIGSDVIGAFIVYDDTASAYRIVVKPTTGNVGIGTTGPSAKLQVNGTNGTTQSIIGYGTQNLYVGVSGTNVDLKSSGSSSGSFTFSTGNTERLRITSGGNVGIGTTNPSKKLHVDGETLLSGGDVEVKKRLYADSYFSSANGPFGGAQQGINAVVRILGKANVHTMTFASGLLIGYTCEGEECEPQPPPYNE